MPLAVRPFQEADYAALVRLHNQVCPEAPHTVAEQREWDERTDPEMRRGRLLAESDGQVVGQASYTQNPWMFHPQKFIVEIEVAPDRRRQGVGRRLYAELLSNLARYNPLLLRGRTREDAPAGVAFAEALGCVEEERVWESWLDPGTVSLAVYAGLEQRLAAGGVRITALAALRHEYTDYAQRLFDLDWEVSSDVPSPEPLTRPSLSAYVRENLETANLLPEAYFVAVHQDRFAGVSSLFQVAAEGELHVGFTGVRPAYRRRGIALALKLRTIAYAQTHGVNRIRTWNSSTNRPMLALNEKLGFVKQPAWIIYKKELG